MRAALWSVLRGYDGCTHGYVSSTLAKYPVDPYKVRSEQIRHNNVKDEAGVI
jgi:hypothetical protein